MKRLILGPFLTLLAILGMMSVNLLTFLDQNGQFGICIGFAKHLLPGC